uniref:Oligosaccharyltransferase gamma subunit n=1 Tax=Ditylenchus dipsaci TaxID=166011 RepID=A0A915DIY9_9BILA
MSLNLDKWKTFVQSSPRNYSMVVMFTVLSQKMNCPICKPAHEEFLILANSYRYAYLHSKSLYFAIVDYEEAPQIFQQLNLNTAPAIYHFPAKGARRNQDTMDFQRQGIDADAMAKFVLDRTEVHVNSYCLDESNTLFEFRSGPSPTKLCRSNCCAFVDNASFGAPLHAQKQSRIFGNRTFWGIVCLCIVLAFMSGQMWNHIRGPPFVMTNPQTRETSFIHGSTQFQLIAETYIVLVMYAAVSAGIIILNDAAQAKTDPGKRRLLSCVGLGMVVIFFSLLLSIFRSKYQGYPYHFLFS